ncbi:M48 family metalloprotease [Gleimia hominis]|uniref:Protease HtpX homolog n=1 Tax=Gleimia hominis TaxID=595468 RepID=A0ABU3I9S4_9ACTO|nr:M48 family metalloprotease [Gleimia hominis]MDT3767116.1 M48 family metalloprotease [Gleimia hominis]
MGSNRLKTALLFGVLWGLLGAIGAGLSAWQSTPTFFWIFMFAGVFMSLYTYWNSDKIALRSMRAVAVSSEQEPQLYDAVAELSSKAGQPMPAIYMAPTRTPNAFATGRNPQHAAVCVTEGIMELLEPRELRAVLGHELSHVYNRDILTSTIAGGIASLITSIAQIFMFGSWRLRNANPLIPMLMIFLAPLAATMLQLGISRTREYEADRAGALLSEDPLALASALRKLERGNTQTPLQATPNQQNVAAMMITNPLRGGKAQLFSTHPPIAERIARLEKIAGY